MPVQKFRTFEDASRALTASGRTVEKSLEERIARLWAFSAALAAPLEFRGVRKYTSLEEADEDRRRMIAARRPVDRIIRPASRQDAGAGRQRFDPRDD